MRGPQKHSAGVDLVTCLYNEPSPARIAELLTCLGRNQANRHIASISVFFDDSRTVYPKVLLNHLQEASVSLEMIDGRPTYRQLFEYANAKLTGRTVIVANADIYFDDTLGLLRHLSLENRILSLTRWNVAEDDSSHLLMLPDEFPNYFSSDAWIFNAPLELDFYCEYELGTMFCDSFLNTQLHASSLAVFNPCLDLRAHHLQRGESASQRFEGQEAVEEKSALWNTEYERNGHRDPVRGVVWSTLSQVRGGCASREVRWRPRHIVVQPDPDGYLDSRCIIRLARIADDFNRNLWIVRDGLDQKTLAFVADVANATVNLIEVCDSAEGMITKGADQDLAELVAANPERDVLVPSKALVAWRPTAQRSAVARRVLPRQPKISVITPVLNGARFIEHAIQSVLQQGHPHLEHLVIDGGSTDGTTAILRRYDHIGWLSATDGGQSAAMNHGFSLATGEIVVCLNADDYFLPGAFASVLPLFHSGAEFVVGKVKVLNHDGSVWINTPRTGHADILRHWEPDAFCVNPLGYFYRREIHESVGGFNATNHFSMDLEFLIACSQRFMLTPIDQLLGVFRHLDGTKTRSSVSNSGLWTRESFPYVDRFVRMMHVELREDFAAARDAGYALREEWRLAGLESAARALGITSESNDQLASPLGERAA